MVSNIRIQPGLLNIPVNSGVPVAGVILLVCLVLPLSAVAADVPALAIADDAIVVLKKIGKPIGKYTAGDTEVWMYDHGTVELLFGKVVAVDLLTPEQLQQRERKRQTQALKKREAQRIARAQGEAEKRRILYNPQYKQLSAVELTHVWDLFQRRYPDIPVDQPAYDAAVSQLKRAKPPAKAMVPAEDPGPPPKVSGKRKRKMKRAGMWVWGDPPAASSPSP